MVSQFPNKKAGYWYRGGGKVFPSGSILEFWGGSGAFKSEVAARKDMNFIFAPSDRYYLDCGYANQYAGGSWCGGMHSWKQIFDWNPYTSAEAGDLQRVLGGEVCMWYEMNNEFNLGTNIFQRAAAMAFRHWAPNRDYSQGEAMESLI